MYEQRELTKKQRTENIVQGVSEKLRDIAYSLRPNIELTNMLLYSLVGNSHLDNSMNYFFSCTPVHW